MRNGAPMRKPRGRMDYYGGGGGGGGGDVFSLPAADFNAGKILHMAWHPQENIIATAAANSLYFFTGA